MFYFTNYVDKNIQLDNTMTESSSKNSGTTHLKECSEELQIASVNSALKASPVYVFIAFSFIF